MDCAVNGRSEPELTNAAACMNGGFFSVQLYRQITVPWFGIARAGDVGVRRGLRRVIIPYSAGPCQVHKYIWWRNCVVGIWRKRSPSTATSVKQRPCTLNCSLIVDFESLRNRCRIAKGTPEGGSIEHGPYTRLHPSADWTRGRRRPATRCDLQQRGLRRTPKSDAAFLWSSIAPRFTSRINTGYANQALSC